MKAKEQKPKKRIRSKGRPTVYTKKLADRICAEIAEGKSLRTVCTDEKMPSRTSVFTWMRKYPDFLDQYARACVERSEALVEETLDIADDATNDWMDVWNDRKKEYERVLDREHVERSKIRIETRKWYASKLKPKKYGDKLDVTSDGKPVNPLSGLTTEELRKLAQKK